ncbi:MAG: SET domain-containing protein [Candidatus Dependentiae bacterium]|nr:SET domain-containing protein [Candidatus Dependentiae bacterium]
MKLYVVSIMSLLSLMVPIYSFESNRNNMETTEFSFIVKVRPDGEFGLFAAHDIAQGTQIFHEPFRLRIMKINDVPDAFKNFTLPLNDEECIVPERFDRLEIGWYMNISSTHANVAKKLEGQYESLLQIFETNTFYAIRDIQAGEEILIDVEQVKKYFPK